MKEKKSYVRGHDGKINAQDTVRTYSDGTRTRMRQEASEDIVGTVHAGRIIEEEKLPPEDDSDSDD